MADTDVTQAALNGGIDPTIDDSEEAESKVFPFPSPHTTVLSTLTGNSANETTCRGDGKGGKKAA